MTALCNIPERLCLAGNVDGMYDDTSVGIGEHSPYDDRFYFPEDPHTEFNQHDDVQAFEQFMQVRPERQTHLEAPRPKHSVSVCKRCARRFRCILVTDFGAAVANAVEYATPGAKGPVPKMRGDLGLQEMGRSERARRSTHACRNDVEEDTCTVGEEN